jgi:cell wall-associated NlpC family hydrolase
MISGKILAVAFAGGILLFAGTKGKKVTGALRNILGGKNPNGASSTAITSPQSDQALSAGSASGSGSIASDALGYIGHPYQYGGYESDPSGWDCSSFVNWVVGHDAGMAIPGIPSGEYTGTSHGPNTLLWLAWGGATTIPRSQLSSGDLCVWQTHMGICTGGNNMVSALDPALGTQQTTITGGSPPGEILVCRRLG